MSALYDQTVSKMTYDSVSHTLRKAGVPRTGDYFYQVYVAVREF